MDYKLASSTWDEKELIAIDGVVKSGMFTMGENVKNFENDFSKFFGVKYSVMVNSGSSANLLAIASLFFRKENPLKRGDEVIVPTVSWSTTYIPLQQYGLKLKFVDVNLKTLNYDIDKLKTAVSPETRLIVCVNLLGNPNDFDSINELCKNHEIDIFEDNCESMGAKYKSQFTGTIGLVGSFSTFFSHHISTMEGGVITTNDEEIYHILLSLRAHGWTRNLPKNNLVCSINDDKFIESFRFVLPGYNVRPLEMSGAIGIEQLKKLPSFLKMRRQNSQTYLEIFKNSEYFIIQEEIEVSSWFGFSFILKDLYKTKRKDLMEYLSSCQIEVRPIVTGNFLNEENLVLKYFDYTIHENIKNSIYLHDNGFFVGNHHFDLKEELIYLKEKFDIFFND
jgi:CDP-6-deoxy-D-xylo-4-hexulose-3-dehydrase